MNAASLDNSERLQRVAKFLSDGCKHSTWDIVRGSDVCAVNSCIAELRANGMEIHCEKKARVFYYRAEL